MPGISNTSILGTLFQTDSLTTCLQGDMRNTLEDECRENDARKHVKLVYTFILSSQSKVEHRHDQDTENESFPPRTCKGSHFTSFSTLSWSIRSRRCELRSTSRRCRFPCVRIGFHQFLRLHLSPSLPKHVKTLDSLAASNRKHPNNCKCIFSCLHHLYSP